MVLIGRYGHPAPGSGFESKCNNTQTMNLGSLVSLLGEASRGSIGFPS